AAGAGPLGPGGTRVPPARERGAAQREPGTARQHRAFEARVERGQASRQARTALSAAGRPVGGSAADTLSYGRPAPASKNRSLPPVPPASSSPATTRWATAHTRI